MNKRYAFTKVLIAGALIVCDVALARESNDFVLPSGVRVHIVEEAFGEGHFKLTGCDESSQECLVNGHIPFGTALDHPSTYIKSLTVSYQGRSYSLDASDMYDAWGSRPLEVKGVVRYFGGKCVDVKNCGFRGLFSDGAGTFVAEWRIVDGRSIRTVLTDSSDVVDLFMKQIDPPDIE